MGIRMLHPVPSMFRVRAGQMTIEFVAIFPVALVIALIAVNAVLFFSDCAEFDRVARNAIRIQATAPTYGQDAEQMRAAVETAIEDGIDKSYLSTDVAVEGTPWGFATYTATLEYSPNLFGMGFRDQILGVSMPKLTHSTSLTVDPYKPGVFL